MSDLPDGEVRPVQISLRTLLLAVAGLAAVLALWRWSPNIGLVASTIYGSLIFVAWTFAYEGWLSRGSAIALGCVATYVAWSCTQSGAWVSGDKVLPMHIAVRDRATQQPIPLAQVEFGNGIVLCSTSSDATGLAVCQARFITDGFINWRSNRRWAIPYGEFAITAQGYKPLRARLVEDLGARPWDYRDGPLDLVAELDPLK